MAPTKQVLLLFSEVFGFDSPVQQIPLGFRVSRPRANYGHAVVSAEIKFFPLHGDAARSICAAITIFGVAKHRDPCRKILE